MRLNVDQQMKLLLTKTEEFWLELLNDYLINVSLLLFFYSFFNENFHVQFFTATFVYD